MGFFTVFLAALSGFIYGAVHYTVLSKPWCRVSGIKLDQNGKPAGAGRVLFPFVSSFVAMMLVAGMMRHIFMMSYIDTVSAALSTGLGVGAFFIAPWIVMNNAYPGRPFMLSVIDGAYAIIGCGIIGLVLVLV